MQWTNENIEKREEDADVEVESALAQKRGRKKKPEHLKSMSTIELWTLLLRPFIDGL